MINLFSKITRYYNQIRGLFSSPLPVGVQEFEDWITRLQATYDLPTRERSDVLFIVASSMMHLGPTVSSRSMYFFVKTIRAGAAKQVAANAFQQVKLAQQAAAKTALTQTVAATTNTLSVVPSDAVRQS